MESFNLDKFKRVNDKIAPDLIGEDEATVLTNVVLDYIIGKPVKRGNFSRYDAGITAGYDLDKIADIDISGTQYILGIMDLGVGFSSSLKKYDISTNTWANYIIGLNRGAKFKMIPFGDGYIFTFDTNDDPRYVAKATGTVSYLEIPATSPVAIQSFHDNGGNLTAHTLYKYVIVGITEDGQMSPPSRPFTHIYQAGTYKTTDDGTNSSKIYFKNLPYMSDTRVTGRMLFRTKSQDYVGGDGVTKTGEVYYLHSILDNDPTGTDYQSTLLDNLADDDLGSDIAIYLNMPTRAKHLAFSNERLFLGNFSQGNYSFVSPPSTNTGGTPPPGYSDGVELDVVDATGGSGALQDSTQYDYKIHYVDKYGRLSKFYHEVSKTTSPGTDIDDHSLEVRHIGGIDRETAKEYPQIAIYRQTGGTGNFYLLGKFGIYEYDSSGLIVVYGGGSFIDYGIANGTEIWSDPTADIKSFPSAITFSDISQPSVMRDENKRQIFFDDGDAITGLFDDQEGLVIFKENTINKLFLSGNPANWRLVKLCKDFGCDKDTTIQKSGNSYYFIYKGKAYRYDYGAEKPVDIGYFFQTTLGLIETWKDSTINDKWWVLQGVTYGGAYYTLVYDMKLDTWYNFTRTNNAVARNVVYYTKYGATEQLLSNADEYVTIYGSDSLPGGTDTETGSTTQITPVVTSKNFKLDGISLARLRKLKFDYTKVNGQDTAITITDADTATTIIVTDNTGSGKKLYEIGIGTASDTLKTTRQFNVSVAGAGLSIWDNLRIEFRPIRRGKAIAP